MSDQKLHPVIWVTAGAVILACAAAVAHFAGWMGGPKTEDTNAALVASQPAVALVTPLPQVAELRPPSLRRLNPWLLLPRHPPQSKPPAPNITASALPGVTKAPSTPTTMRPPRTHRSAPIVAG